jgi:hypothetical protein
MEKTARMVAGSEAKFRALKDRQVQSVYNPAL